MSIASMNRRGLELLILLLLIAITTPVFWLTNLDQTIAALFYMPVDHVTRWPWQHWWLWDYLFRYASRFPVIIAISALLIAALSYLSPRLIPWRRPSIYIVLVIALGPGLIVNVVFKDHWGRPRPVHISEFGGQYTYVPPLQIGHSPDKSFPCGHCSVAYMFFGLYFLSRKRKVFYFTLTLMMALMMALARMAAGGHFISDVLWSGYLVFFVAWLLYYGWYEERKPA